MLSKFKHTLEAGKLINQARYPTNPIIPLCFIHMMLGLNEISVKIEKNASVVSEKAVLFHFLPGM